MGCVISCDKCPSAARNSVITFSEDLVFKIADGIEPEPLTEQELHDIELPDSEWFEKLRCIDNSHSNAYGINKQSAYALMNRLEQKTKDMQSNKICSHADVLRCFNHTDCPLECFEDVKHYIECTDEKRVRIMIKKIEEWAEEAIRLQKIENSKRLKC